MIFVLAGRECRKRYGALLLLQGWTTRLLLSVDRFEVRHLSRLDLSGTLDLVAIASTIEPRKRHYFVELQGGEAEATRIAVGRLGTWCEVQAFSHWLSRNRQVRSAMVVSSGFHLRRVRMCCRKLVRNRSRLIFVSVPDEDRHFRRLWWRSSKSLKLVISDVMKIAAYRALSPFLMTRSVPFSHALSDD